MISNVFIERPRLAFVISIVITLAGLIAIFAIPLAQYPDIVPPQVEVSGRYPGRQRRGGRAERRAADRAAGQRRRQHALHEVDQRRRRQLHADRDLRARHRSRHQHRQRAEPGQPRRAAAAGGGHAPGPDDQEGLVGAAAGHPALFAERHLRRALSDQLRHHQHHRHAEADPRRRRRLDVQLAGLQHADLARPEQAHQPRSDARPTSPRRSAARTSRRRSAGSAPRRWRPTSSSS